MLLFDKLQGIFIAQKSRSYPPSVQFILYVLYSKKSKKCKHFFLLICIVSIYGCARVSFLNKKKTEINEEKKCEEKGHYMRSVLTL